MALSKVQIISRAITLLNKGPITSIADGGVFATTAEEQFDMLLPSILSKKNWRFATAIQQLSLSVLTPLITEWTKIYTLPADFLALVRLHPWTLDFQIFQNKLLYSNTADLFIEYRFLPDVTRLPEYFVDFFVWELAASLAYTGASSESLAEKIQKMADRKLREATAVDSQNHPNEAIYSNDVVAVRGGGFDNQRGISN